MIQGLSTDLFKGTSVTEELGELHLLSNEDANITMIPAFFKGTRTAQVEENSQLVLVNAVVVRTNPPTP